MEGGLERPGRIPGVELGPGVESPLGVGVLDFSPGVPALSRWWKRHGSARLDIVQKKIENEKRRRWRVEVPTDGISLDLREEELAEDAVDAGLQGSFLRRRALSRPFSRGEGRGVPRGEVGSW